MGRGYNANARRNHVNEDYFKAIDSEAKAYWLGFIQADGCIYIQETTYRFQMNLSGKDKDHLIKFNEAVDSTYKVSDKLIRANGKEYTSCTVKINSKPFCEALMHQGIVPQKTLNDHFPDLHGGLMRHYVRGFFDGDGSIKLYGNRARIDFIGGKKFLEKLANTLETEAGVSLSEKAMDQNVKSQAWMLSIHSRENVEKMHRYLYDGSTIYLHRKLEKFERYVNNLSPLRE